MIFSGKLRQYVLLIVGVILIGAPTVGYAQNDACKTFNQGRRNAGCQHPGARCDAGAGPGTGRCVFQSGDGVCDCVGPSTLPPPTTTATVGNALSSPV
jgi:hypothetical protein